MGASLSSVCRIILFSRLGHTVTLETFLVTRVHNILYLPLIEIYPDKKHRKTEVECTEKTSGFPALNSCYGISGNLPSLTEIYKRL